jgi:LPXTG-motif cell wall-anchored protein
VVGGGAGLAATGADVAWWIAFGIVMLVAGLFLLRNSRRRNPVAADSAGDSSRL